jgi:hypothetical protein
MSEYGYDEDETARAVNTLTHPPSEDAVKTYHILSLYNDLRYQNLIKFYHVDNPRDLIEEMEKHIQRLQDDVNRWKPTQLWGSHVRG